MRWATCDANLESEFEAHFEDERIYEVPYFLLFILQLQILAGEQVLRLKAAVPPGVVAPVDCTNTPDVYARFRKANGFRMKDMPPVVTACYLLMLGSLPEGSDFQDQKSEELLSTQLELAKQGVRQGVGSASASVAAGSASEQQRQPQQKSLRFSIVWCIQSLWSLC